jgi:hypothetical protein
MNPQVHKVTLFINVPFYIGNNLKASATLELKGTEDVPRHGVFAVSDTKISFPSAFSRLPKALAGEVVVPSTTPETDLRAILSGNLSCVKG